MKTILPAVSLAAILAVAGCNLPQPQADTVRHFTLGGPVTTPPVPDATVVRPVQVAGHLRQRALAVRVAEHEVTYLEDFRWAEPLDGAITQLLRNRLNSVAGGAVVSVQIERCEPVRSDGNKFQLSATYTISVPAAERGQPRQAVFSSSPRTWDGRDYGALVGQIQDAVGELADAIATDLAKK